MAKEHVLSDCPSFQHRGVWKFTPQHSRLTRYTSFQSRHNGSHCALLHFGQNVFTTSFFVVRNKGNIGQLGC
uniref:Uncharacterized protein n=1 Tax=Anguilla anguilla TaxID=7936 RepID=A0A0E9WWS0_ANGAN